MQTKRLINNLLFALLGSLYCWAVMTAIVKFSFLQMNALPLALLSLTGVCGVLALTYTKRICLIGLVGIAVAGGVWLLVNLPGGKTGQFFGDVGYLFKMIASVEDYNPLYNFQMLAIIVLLIAVFICFSLKTTFNFYLLSGFGVAMFCIALNESMEIGFEFYVLVFILITLLLTKLYARYSRKKKLDSLSLGKFLLRALPLSLCVVLLASVISLPFAGLKPSELLSYNTFQNFIDSGFPSAFSKNAKFNKGEVTLGGNLSPTNEPVLKIQADESTYLTGSINDVYTGHSWKKSKTEFNTYHSEYPTVDADTALRLVNSGYFSSIFQIKEMTVTYLSDDNTVFSPNKTTRIQKDNGVIFINNLGEFESQDQIRADQSYRASYVSDNYQQEFKGQSPYRLTDFPVDMRTDLYSDVVFNEQNMQTERPWTKLKFEEYLSGLYSAYSALPGSITARTRTLASEITSAYADPMEKALAIQSYLTSNYTYTLSPGTPDPEKDFVDEFLFDVKKGYCTSFATSMAVLSRIVGIPSRYVEGYAIPSERQPDGSYLVKSRNAHAWAELYIEDYGWMKFESTPPYAYAQQEGNTPPLLLDENEENPEALKQNLEDLGIDQRQLDPNSAAQDELDTESSPESSSENTGGTNVLAGGNTGILWFALLLPAALIGAVVLRILSRRRKDPNPLHVDKRLAQQSFDQIIRLARFVQLEIRRGETPISFGKRLSRMYPELPFTQAAALYSSQQYGGSDLTCEEIQLIYTTSRDFENLVKSSSNRLRYLFCHYITQSI